MASSFSRFMLRFICLLLCLVVVASTCIAIFPQKARAWGAVDPGGQTHQYMLRQAYALLEKDPAFKGVKFPSIDDIVANEGVSVVSMNGFLKGAGPDVEKASNYSQHYYNPNLSSPGKAPTAVGDEYTKLVNALFANNNKDAAHAAAWSSHFLSDMLMPYHNLGCSKEQILDIYNKQGGKGASKIILDQTLFGDLDFRYVDALGRDANFKVEIERFLAHAGQNPKADWFDPWYYDGEQATVMTSSHVLWEAAVRHPLWYGLEGYNEDWVNSTMNFSTGWSSQKTTATQFTIAATSDFPYATDYPSVYATDAIEAAVQKTCTLWRASFSALKPTIDIQVPDYNKPANIKVVAKVSNIGSGDSMNTQVKLTVNGGTISGSNTQPLKTVAAGKTGQVIFNVVVSSISGCSVKLETIGSYTQPDLQYASVEARSDPLPPSKTPTPTNSNTTGIDHSIVIVVNCSSQMKEVTIDQMVDKVIRALDAFPDTGMEVGLVGYGSLQREEDGIVIDLPVFVSKRVIRDAMVNLYGGTGKNIGKAPLAQAITRAGELIRDKAKASSATIILISNSGVDNCGGDPIQAAKGLNPSTVIQRESWFPFNSYIEAASKIPVRLQVLGFEVTSLQEEQRLKAIATAGSGHYYSVSDITQLASVAGEAIKSSIQSSSSGGIRFQTWWFMAGGALILFLIIIITLSRRRPKPAASLSPNRVAAPANSRFCPECGTQTNPGAAFCVKCGTSLRNTALVPETPVSVAPLYCPQCGIQNLAGSTFCGKCGARITPDNVLSPVYTNQPVMKEKKVSGAWWILPVVLAIVGGLIAWAAVKPVDPKKAGRLLALGIGITVFWIASIVPNLANLLS